MKRPAEISLILVPLLAVACTNQAVAPDPCLAQSYNAPACQYAVDHRGYYNDGIWYPHIYSHPFFYYGGMYSTFIAGGGRPSVIDGSHYAPAVGAGTTRGGFGTSGAIHASGASGAGE